jgi:cytochrome oxidase Cu insertion factor (SCO1/SenC/PrrC family)
MHRPQRQRLVLLAALSALPWLAAPAHAVTAGQSAPAFEVKDAAGKTVKLSDYKGKTVVLWFYPKADTPG